MKSYSLNLMAITLLLAALLGAVYGADSTAVKVSAKETALQASGEKINLNTADAVTLQKLPGIGAKTAQAIVDARSEKPFSDMNDVIVRVKGIGSKKAQKMGPYVTF